MSDITKPDLTDYEFFQEQLDGHKEIIDVLIESLRIINDSINGLQAQVTLLNETEKVKRHV